MSKILYEEKVKEEIKFEPEEFLSSGEDKKYITFSRDKTRVVVSDAVGRHYYSSEEDFKRELKRFLKED
jgi:hypothetical protein